MNAVRGNVDDKGWNDNCLVINGRQNQPVEGSKYKIPFPVSD